MGSDQHHTCNTGLVLGLGSQPTKIENYPSINASTSDHPNGSTLKFDHQLLSMSLEPSLTLSLSDSACKTTATAVVEIDVNKASEEHSDIQQSSHTTASSFSNTNHDFIRVKRERDVGMEDTELERVSSRVSDEDEDGSTRKKLRLAKEQSALLEDSFKERSTLNPKQKQDLARRLNLRPRQVEVWFQNRRARTKLKQTEFDCEYLKKCCETLTDENRRLQKELQELKALKLAAPLYMQLPAATLAMCPACERIGGSRNVISENSSKAAYARAPKPHHYYNPFTHSSAAC